jgi:hypothetical protein
MNLKFALKLNSKLDSKELRIKKQKKNKNKRKGNYTALGPKLGFRSNPVPPRAAQG